MSGWKRKQTPFLRASGEIVFSRESLVLLVKGDGKLEDVLDWATFQMMDCECHSKQWKGGARTVVGLCQILGPIQCHMEAGLGIT